MAEAPAALTDSTGGHEGGGTKVVMVALGVNVAIAVFKFITAFISASTAMLAEAVHSLADSANQVFLLIGMRRSIRPPTARHPFGYGSETYFWSFMVAGSIFLIGAVVSIWEGAEKLLHLLQGKAVKHGDARWALVVLVVSIALELISLRAAVQEFKHLTKGKGLRQTLKDIRDPTVLTVLFEDLAALFGLVAALLGVTLSHLTGNLIYDAIASIVVGLALAVVAVVLGRDSKALLIGEAVPEEDHQRMEALVRGFQGVLELVHLRTLHIGPKEVLVAIKARFQRNLTMDQLEQRINELEAALRHDFPQLRRIYVEPGFDEAKMRQLSAPDHRHLNG